MVKEGEDIVLFQNLFLKGMACNKIKDLALIDVQLLCLYLNKVIYLSAFVSVFFEISPLLGSDGLQPVNLYLERLKMKGLDQDMSRVPTVFWWSKEINEYLILLLPFLRDYNMYDNCLHMACLIGITISLLILISNKFMGFLSYLILWSLYISIFHVGQVFFQFQWDIMLLEVGFLTMFFTPTWKDGKIIIDELSSVIRDLLKWLAFRLNYSSGIVKLTSECPTWWNLTALNYHFQGQPLPNPLSWHFHHLPEWVKKLFVAQNFVSLIGASLILWAPYRRFRIFGMLMLLSEQFIIILSGNYNFFNFLTALITLAAGDDEFLRFCVPKFVFKILGLNFLNENDKNIEIQNKNKKNLDQTSMIIDCMKLLIECLVFIVFVVVCYWLYFPIESIIGGEKLPFSHYDVKMNLVNGYIPVIVMVLSFLYCINNIFYYSLKFSYASQTFKMFETRAYVGSLKRMFALIFATIMYMHSSYMFFAGLDRQINLFPLNIPAMSTLSQLASPFHIANQYGLFRRMTGINGREELIFEVSEDGVNFKELDFFYKPGPLDKLPKFSIPYHPRLDWQLWFSAMDNYITEGYLVNLMYKLVNNKPTALELIEHNPLEGKSIRFLNVIKYIYTFTTPEEKQKTGQYWKRTKLHTLVEGLTADHKEIEQSLTDFNLPLDSKKYPLNILRRIPLLPIIWTILVLGLIKNTMKN